MVLYRQPELIPVLGSRPASDINSCISGGRLTLLSTRPVIPFPAAGHHCPYASTESLLGERQVGVNNLPKVTVQCSAVLGQELNPPSLDRKSDALLIVPP